MSGALYDIAPRLARAHADRRFELAFDDLGGGVKHGDAWCELLFSEHRVVRCRCGGRADRYRRRFRINAGTVSVLVDQTCRGCGAGAATNSPLGFSTFEVFP